MPRGRLGHGYFSAEKFRDPVSHRRAPTFESPDQNKNNQTSWIFLFWCPEGDSNSHTLRHTHLKGACLPISTSGLTNTSYTKNNLFSKKKHPFGCFYFYYSLVSSTSSSVSTSFDVLIFLICRRIFLAALSRMW